MFRNTRPDDMLAHVLRSVVAQAPGVDVNRIDDAIIGCAMPEAEQGMNVARIGVLLAGLPNTIAAQTVNRFCSSGLQAVAQAADAIRLGNADLMLAGGTESMSMVPMMGNKIAMAPSVFDNDHVAIAYGMGITAEKVAEEWKVSREDQDAFALASHQKAMAAIQNGEFKDEISPYEIVSHLPDLADGQRIITRNKIADTDEGPRPDSSAEGLAAAPGVPQRPVRRHRHRWQLVADERRRRRRAAGLGAGDQGLRPDLAGAFRQLSVAGVRPEVMGIGPIAAIPKALKQAGLTQDQLDWIELNEAFAAQSLAVIRDCGLDPAKVNPLGGAIALGHPLGATGAIRTATLLHGLRRRQQKYGMVTMCIGTGMGAAGIFEAL